MDLHRLRLTQFSSRRQRDASLWFWREQPARKKSRRAVRELRNAVETYLALGQLQLREQGKSSDLEEALARFVDPELPYAKQTEQPMARFSRVYRTRLLQRTDGNRSEAARVSGLERSYLGKLLAKLDVLRPVEPG